ncbi:MAG: hypothetical protein US51_C0008G0001, partial [Microgenomates group bacterium GW2011_GWA2_37_6]
MRKILFILLFFTFLFLVSSSPSLANHDFKARMGPGFFNNNGSTDWEVAYKFKFNNSRGTTGNTWFKWTNITPNHVNSANGRTYDWGNTALVNPPIDFGPNSGKHPEYQIQWATTCIDPLADPTYVSTTFSNNVRVYLFRVDVTLKNNAGAPLAAATNTGRSVSYAYGNAITGRTDLCPFNRYSIDGRVFIDDDRDGNQGSGEPDYQGAIIKKTGDGNPKTDITGNNGYYRFYNLPSGGNYKVEFTNKPNGYVFTKPTDGTWTGINLPPNHTVANGNPFNFGIAPANGPIGGTVYIDKNGSNDFNSGEGYSGATVYKDKGTNNQEKRTSDPDYNFGGLTGGSEHDIKLEDFPSARLNVEGDNPKRNVRVPNSNANFRLNFQKYTIKGHVYWDPDGNG